MTPDFAVQVIRDAFWMTLFVGGPILLIGFVGGVLVSVLQILTSMQDPAFNTVPRLLIFLAAAMLLMPWMTERMMAYTARLLGGLERFAS
ncbi:MAG: flagellar biosynthetic protein FliQ [Acidobacteria bacterium]|nr:flagellar biosynthetic protein FliQ [Acidobacteriota bacterium]